MKFVIVGTGSIAQRHMRNLVLRGHEDLVAVSGTRREKSLTVDGVNVPVAPRLDRALDAGADAVLVCDVSARHEETATAALSAGAHIYLEKPAATSAAGCQRLADAAARTGLVVAVGQQLRLHPQVRRIQHLLREGALGPLVSAHADQGEHVADYHSDEDYRQTYTVDRAAGGGVLLTQIHQPDLLVSLMGPPTRVHALAGPSNLSVEVEDNVSYQYTTREGLAVSGHVDYLRRPKVWTMQLSGEEGILDWDYHRSELNVRWADPSRDSYSDTDPVDRNSLFLAALDDFLSAITECRDPWCTPRDAVAPLQLVDSIRASLQTGERAEVTPVDSNETPSSGGT